MNENVDKIQNSEHKNLFLKKLFNKKRKNYSEMKNSKINKETTVYSKKMKKVEELGILEEIGLLLCEKEKVALYDLYFKKDTLESQKSIESMTRQEVLKMKKNLLKNMVMVKSGSSDVQIKAVKKLIFFFIRIQKDALTNERKKAVENFFANGVLFHECGGITVFEEWIQVIMDQKTTTMDQDMIVNMLNLFTLYLMSLGTKRNSQEYIELREQLLTLNVSKTGDKFIYFPFRLLNKWEYAVKRGIPFKKLLYCLKINLGYAAQDVNGFFFKENFSNDNKRTKCNGPRRNVENISNENILGKIPNENDPGTNTKNISNGKIFISISNQNELNFNKSTENPIFNILDQDLENEKNNTLIHNIRTGFKNMTNAKNFYQWGNVEKIKQYNSCCGMENVRDCGMIPSVISHKNLIYEEIKDMTFSDRFLPIPPRIFFKGEGHFRSFYVKNFSKIVNYLVILLNAILGSITKKEDSSNPLLINSCCGMSKDCNTGSNNDIISFLASDILRSLLKVSYASCPFFCFYFTHLLYECNYVVLVLKFIENDFDVLLYNSRPNFAFEHLNYNQEYSSLILATCQNLLLVLTTILEQHFYVVPETFLQKNGLLLLEELLLSPIYSLAFSAALVLKTVLRFYTKPQLEKKLESISLISFLTNNENTLWLDYEVYSLSESCIDYFLKTNKKIFSHYNKLILHKANSKNDNVKF